MQSDVQPPLSIRVLYSCPQCGLSRAACLVPARREEDVLTWMDGLIRQLGADHARRSPACHPDQLHDLMIPVMGTDRVGGPIQH